MSKQLLLQQIDNLLNDLCNTFPNNKEILLFKEKYNLLKSVNSKIIVEYFISYIYPHKDNILNEKESFFLDGGGQEEIKNEKGLKFRDNIKILWCSEMSDQNKDIVWKYFKIFILLCEKYINETGPK